MRHQRPAGADLFLVTFSTMDITFAGYLPTTEPSGTSFVTTLPAVTMALGPIFTPYTTMALAPMKQLSKNSISPE